MASMAIKSDLFNFSLAAASLISKAFIVSLWDEQVSSSATVPVTKLSNSMACFPVISLCASISIS
uniref:Uncharacterized protein n=1 Tax=Arundo donax TaxID=35708 RepID=A0A0A8Z8Y0_ARUDO